eukprot:9752420-Ditylum_brightwellii.AAC.1
MGSCGWFSSWRAVLNSFPLRALVNKAPISASAAEAMTLQRSSQTECMGPFGGATDSSGLVGLHGQLLRKKCPPALLRARGALRYDASLWMCNTMPLAWKRIVASGCVAQ